MRSKLLLFPCLILLSLSLACSGNKASDQSASDASGTDQTASNSAPSGSATGPMSGQQRGGVRQRKSEAEAAIVIPAGTPITVRTVESISSKTAQSGDSFTATLAEPIAINGHEVIPAGAKADGTVTEAQAQGKIKGAAVLRLELTRLYAKGNSYPVQTTMDSFAQKGKGKRTAIATGGGAALGGIIGGLVGGGKGAGIGIAAGAGAGLAGGALTGNKQIVLPAETALTFKLKNDVTLK